MKKSLLIIDKHQFGYLTDSFKWCEYLRDDYDITIVTPQGSNPPITLNNINIIRVSGKNKIVFGIKFLLSGLIQILLSKGSIIVVYFEKCQWFKKVFPQKRMVLDIRTLCVDPDELVRREYNKRLYETSLLYDHITGISNGIIELLGIERNKVSLLPLGADSFCNHNKSYTDLHLLYVGTLTGRKMLDTVEGLRLFINNHPHIKVSYDIVGDGWGNELDEIRSFIINNGLNEFVTAHGKVPYTELKPFFERCNVGISYIPQTEYFDFQPPTKTYEYVLSGMVCLATSTLANKEIINETNGVLIDDNPNDFAKGLEVIVDKSEKYESSLIRETLDFFRWPNIVNYYLKPLLNQ